VDVQNAEWETSQHLKEEEFTRAEALAFVRLPAQEPLARIRGVLSGGADSAPLCVPGSFDVRTRLRDWVRRNSRAD